jgi:hypothetical protein
VDGCDKRAHAKGFCSDHYERAQHPLKAVWKLLRSRNPGQFPKSWASFEAFLSDVGDRPNRYHQLRRRNPDAPYSKENAYWLPPVGKSRGSYTKAEMAAYIREWNFKKRYSITGEQYDALLASQGGVCASCKKPESHTYPSGKVKALAVDHDHETGEIRGLLCFNCNQGIGRFRNDPAVLRAAADYLDAHKSRSHLRLVCTSEDAA